MSSVAVPIGTSYTGSTSYSTGTISSTAANNVNYRNTAVRNTLLSGARRTLSLGARALLRFNPYVFGAMMLYDGYDLYKSYSGASSSGSSSDSSSGAVPIDLSGGSVDSTSTTPSFNIPPLSQLGTVIPDVANANNANAVSFLGNLASATTQINDTVQQTLDVPSSYEGSNLLEVLISNNEKTNKILASLVQAVNNFAVSSSVSSSSITSGLSFIGSVLSTQAQQDALYYKLADARNYATDTVTPDDVKNSIPDIVADSDDAFDSSFYDGILNPSSMQETLYTYTTGTDYEGVDESDYESPVSQALDTDALVSAINPPSREEYFTKTNQISDFKLTPTSAVDLDGNTISDIAVTPLELEHIEKSATARKHTDENNFELDDADFDMWSLPNMEFLLNYDYSEVDNIP